MSLTITSIYASALGIVFLGLMVAVIHMRAKTGISLSHGDNVALMERSRRYGNFVETAPIALILLVGMEIGGASGTLLHSVGGLLLVGRILHPLGLSQSRPTHPLRIIGTLATQVSILISTGYLASQAMGF